MQKYERITEDAGEIDIYSLDQACADIDGTIGYIRKIIIKIPSIVEKRNEIRRKRLDEDRRRRLDEAQKKKTEKKNGYSEILR